MFTLWCSPLVIPAHIQQALWVPPPEYLLSSNPSFSFKFSHSSTPSWPQLPTLPSSQTARVTFKDVDFFFFSSLLSYCNLEPNNESPFHGLGGPMIWPCPLSICILYLCLLTLQCFSPTFRGCTLAAPLCAGFCLIGSDLCCSVTSQLDACSRTSDQCLGFSTQ